MDSRNMGEMSPGELMRQRTYDNKFTMAHWWVLAERAQHGRGKYNILSQFVKRGDLVFDVGANRGIMTLVFREFGARVVAVEPLFAAAPHLVKEFGWKFREDTDVIAVANAVSDEIGSVAMRVQNNLPYLSSCANDWMTESAHAKMYRGKATSPARVRTTTLDALIEKFGEPVFIKVDVEGYESIAISGLTVPVKALSFEFHEDWLHSAQGVIKHLAGVGNYEYNYALDNRGVMVLDKYVSGVHLITHLKRTLTKRGRGSWGDIYARRT